MLTMATLAGEVRRLRKKMGQTVTELSRRSEVPRSRIYAIEKGETPTPTRETLVKIAEGLSRTREGGRIDEQRLAAAAAVLEAASGYNLQPLYLTERQQVTMPGGREVAARLARATSEIMTRSEQEADQITAAIEAIVRVRSAEPEES